MQLQGTVVDQSTGLPLANVTVWEIPPDGQSADVIGFTDGSGKYNVTVDNSASTVNFVTDNYIGTAVSAQQAAGSDQILLQPDGTVTAKITIAGIPAWVWVALGLGFIFLIPDKKRR